MKRTWVAGLTAFIVAIEFTQAATADISTLKLVQVLWRHGDRSPTRVFPTDTNTPEKWNWTGGLGELTELGMQQHYRLGGQIKERYAGFLADEYNANTIHVETSYYNRTVMSAMANLGGMFPSFSTIPPSNTSFWKPIPVFSRPKTDTVMWIDKPCPTYDNIFWQNVMVSKEVNDIMENNKDFLDFLRNKSGESLTTFDDIWKIYDPLISETVHSATNPRPSWVNQTVMDKVIELYELSTHYYYNDETRRRLRGGPMLGEMIGRIDQYLSSESNFSLKYYVYSAHDTNIIAMLEALEAYKDIPHSPEYATALFVELHKTAGGYTIEVYHSNMTDRNNVVPVSIGNCGSPCTLEKFRERSARLIPTDWDLECGNTVEPKKKSWDDIPTWRIVAIVFIVLFGLSVLVFSLLLLRTARGNRVKNFMS